MKKQTHLHLGWPEAEYNIHFWVIIALMTSVCFIKTRENSFYNRRLYNKWRNPDCRTDAASLTELFIVHVALFQTEDHIFLDEFSVSVNAVEAAALRVWCTTPPQRIVGKKHAMQKMLFLLRFVLFPAKTSKNS